MEREDVKEAYRQRRETIEKRLQEFHDLQDASDERIFRELVFVLLSSQSPAREAWKAAEKLEKRGLLLEGDRESIAQHLEDTEVKYTHEKSGYIVKNRKRLSQPTLARPGGSIKIGDRLNPERLDRTRENLVDELEGIGWKGASHFLRNVGYGNSFAIISGHIAEAMHELGLTDSPQPPAARERYMTLEKKIQDFSADTGIEVQALDLVLWSMKTGEVFR
ncbi:MAG: hypothetical protein ABEJ75_01450 [Candidatus Nanohaloarchaea archaeon]